MIYCIFDLNFVCQKCSRVASSKLTKSMFQFICGRSRTLRVFIDQNGTLQKLEKLTALQRRHGMHLAHQQSIEATNEIDYLIIDYRLLIIC